MLKPVPVVEPNTYLSLLLSIHPKMKVYFTTNESYGTLLVSNMINHEEN